MTRRALNERRNEESRRAAAAMGVPPPIFLNHPVLADDSAQVAELADLLVARKVDAVFVPFLLDGHPRHRTANYTLAAALRSIPWNTRVFGYEVWGLCIPNVVLIIDDAIETKAQALGCFEYANSALDYRNSARGLNMFIRACSARANAAMRSEFLKSRARNISNWWAAFVRVKTRPRVNARWRDGSDSAAHRRPVVGCVRMCRTGENPRRRRWTKWSEARRNPPYRTIARTANGTCRA